MDKHHDQHPSGKTLSGETLAYCPVMEGIPVNIEEAEEKGRVREYEGKKYYLCCDACITEFEMSPENYAN